MKQRTKTLKFESLNLVWKLTSYVVVEKFSGNWIDSKSIQIAVKNVPIDKFKIDLKSGAQGRGDSL